MIHFISRFVGLGTLPMQAPELAVQEIKRAVGIINFIISTKYTSVK